MAESYRPVTAAGVKSTLKSLRTRVGLQPDRLATTELALDALERLQSVRSLQAKGRNRVVAIVEVVREAARSLPPTDSLIVDAALSLKLQPNAANSASLYGPDLSDRRQALLDAWDELHVSRGEQPPPKPTVRSLRLDREDTALGLLAGVLVGESPIISRVDAGISTRRQTRDDQRTATVVIGAAVLDDIYRTRDMPVPNTSGEASDHEELPGGKGLNQAVGLARLGVPVRLISPVGSDSTAAEILDYLTTEGVDVRHLEMIQGARSPRTLVMAFPNGSFFHMGWKNKYEVRLGSEYMHSPAVRETMDSASVILLTQEAPRETIAAVFDILASSKHCPVILTASPRIEYPPLSGSDLKAIDYLIASPWELQHILEDAGDDDDALGVRDIIDRLLLAGVRAVCVLGHNEAQIYSFQDDFTQPPPAAVVITDESATKDAFAAALASRIATHERATEEDFLYAYYAMLAAGMRFGTSSSLPTNDEILSLQDMINQRTSPRKSGRR